MLWYLKEERTGNLFDSLVSNSESAALVKIVSLEHHDTNDLGGSGSGICPEDPGTLFLNVLATLPNIESLQLPRYVNGYDGICEWYTKVGRSELKHLDALPKRWICSSLSRTSSTSRSP